VLLDSSIVKPDNSLTSGVHALGTQAEGAMDAIAASQTTIISLGSDASLIQLVMINKTDPNGCSFDVRWWKLR
jgi:hypothetical protein